MIDHARLGWRAAVGAALAACLTMVGSGAALAETQSGQHGDYYFVDDTTQPEATCVYDKHDDLSTIVVHAPKLWYPNEFAEKHHEHGQVGWRAIVRTSATPATGPWKVTTKTSIQKRTAYEDQDVPYGDGTKAPLTAKTIAWHGSTDNSVSVGVVVQAFWYAHDGHTLGWVKHPAVYIRYKTVNLGTGLFTNSCNTHGIAG